MKYVPHINVADRRVKAGLGILGLVLLAVVGTLLINKATFKPSANGETAIVELNQNNSLPDVLIVKVGTTVTWVNRASVERHVVSTPFPEHTDLPGLDSRQNISTGGSYSYTFMKRGTFGYVDYLNPSVSGKVIVE
jgi:plastocyanin